MLSITQQKDTDQQITPLENGIYRFVASKKHTLSSTMDTTLGYKGGKNYSKQMELRDKQV